MIFINHFGSSKAAKDYHGHLSKGDYYAKDAERLTPRYEGRIAALLGIEGNAVDQESFFKLCDNQHPVTGKQLTLRTKGDRRAMTDLTFDVPKGVTLAALNDERVEAAVDAAIDETMRSIEDAMCVRIRKGGMDTDRLSGNMLWVTWAHETTRPLEDGTVDPQKHRHVTVMNVSYDPVEKKYKACQFGGIVRDKAYYQAAYHTRLAGRLEKLGYGVRRDGNSFRIVGIDKALCDKFSRRHDVIDRKAAELGIDSSEGRAKVAKLTRNKKSDELSNEELKREWFARMTPAETYSLEQADKGLHKSKPITAQQAMDYAIAHCFERQSVITEKKLLAEALAYGVGRVTVEDCQGQLSRPDLIIKARNGVRYVTTLHVCREEIEMVGFVRDGRGTCRKLGKEGIELAAHLSAEQRRAAEAVLSSRDRVIGLRGRAGTGKTKLWQATVPAIERSGRKVWAFAPSAEASRGVLRSEGFKDADTVERLLLDKEYQKKVNGGVLLIDEAGLLSVKDMNRLFSVAKEQDCRMILSGDSGQHGPVPRGDGLRIIEQETGLKFAELREVRRQKGDAYRQAVALISKGDSLTRDGTTGLRAGIDKLDRMGAIVEVRAEERFKGIAADYLAAVAENKTALVVSPTHVEGERVTTEIRNGLKASGALHGKERKIATLTPTNWTTAERQDADNYEPGMIVQFHQNAKGFRRGEKLEVTGRSVEGPAVKLANGKETVLPVKDAERFQVYRPNNLSLAVGDSVRITQNGFTKETRRAGRAFKSRLNNGAVYQVAGFSKSGDLELANGFVVPKDYGHLNYGYTTTSHSAQGRTCDRVLISMGQESLGAANREQFYVSVSRGREAVRLYTDDKRALFDAVEKSGVRLSATELLKSEHTKATGARVSRLRKLVQSARMRERYEAVVNRGKERINWVREEHRHERRN
jgi:conjugative relaxase-like TrwC/TraI family protein